MKKITIIGTGYVGLVSGAGLAEFGHEVNCADIDREKINSLNNGEIPIYESGLEDLVKRNRSAGRLTFTTGVDQAIQSADVIFIAVGTPPDKNGSADLKAVAGVAMDIGRNLNGYKVICTKSTVPVGTGSILRGIIEKEAGENADFDYVSNPEFLREGAAVNDFLHPDRVVLGADSEKAFDILKEIYRPLYIIKTPIIQTNVATAEMIKYASNAFLALKISYINEIANLCEAVGADVHTVSRTMGLDGRISAKFLHPGPGFGGSCFPKDTQALAALGKENQINLATVEAAIKTNISQKKLMVAKLRSLAGGSFNNLKVAVLGLSFKPQTDDVRDSPAVNMLESLVKEGAKVRAYDPIASRNMALKFPHIEYVSSWKKAVTGAQAMVIMTEWNEFRGIDLQELHKLMETPILLDTRNILDMKALHKLNFIFDNVGRKKFKHEN